MARGRPAVPGISFEGMNCEKPRSPDRCRAARKNARSSRVAPPSESLRVYTPSTLAYRGSIHKARSGDRANGAILTFSYSHFSLLMGPRPTKFLLFEHAPPFDEHGARGFTSSRPSTNGEQDGPTTRHPSAWETPKRPAMKCSTQQNVDGRYVSSRAFGFNIKAMHSLGSCRRCRRNSCFRAARPHHEDSRGFAALCAREQPIDLHRSLGRVVE